LLTYNESLRLLLQLERFGMKFGLRGISRLLKTVSDPQREFKCIHVAGTNGKGSTASMIAAVLMSAGYNTGLYTSPHLLAFEERIRVNGKPMSRPAVARLTSRLRRHILEHSPTFFEATTALAFAHFAQEEVDVAVVETGLGGRLDSTNVIRPLVSVITNVGLDHTEILGTSVKEIAFEKAGIIKRGRPCVTGAKSGDALPVIRRVARERGSELRIVKEYSARVHSSDPGGIVLDFSSKGRKLDNLRLSLPGRHQLDNLAVALATIDLLKRISSFDISEQAERAGLSNVQKLTGLRGRLDLVRQEPRIIVDVAHNPDAIKTLVSSLAEFRLGKVITVFGVMKDKEFLPMVRDLAGISAEAIAVAPATQRARSASDVAAGFQQVGCAVRAALSVEEGVHLASERAGNQGTILVTGSHYVVGEALKALKLNKT
jgi:dihydrofolate synthase/folylpolyglutamate synthase